MKDKEKQPLSRVQRKRFAETDEDIESFFTIIKKGDAVQGPEEEVEEQP